MAPLAELVQERVRLLTEVEPMIAFLIDDPVVIDDDSWTKAMVKGKAAPEMLDAAIAALDELTAWEAAGIRLAVEAAAVAVGLRSEEHTSELQSLMRTSFDVLCLNKKCTSQLCTHLHVTIYTT